MIRPPVGQSFIHDGRTYCLDQTTLAPEVDYECFVCKAFMTEPQRTCSGVNTDTGHSWSHRLCRPCLTQLQDSNCPLCRREIDKPAATTDFASIANLRVHCPNQGCPTTLPVSPTMAEAKRHLAEECAKEIIKCPAQCGTPGMKRETLRAHEQICPRRYICECGQIFSGAVSRLELDLHANGTPEQHLLTRVVRYWALPPVPPGAEGAQQPVPVAYTPQTRVWAGVPCLSIATDVYQSTDSPQTLFIAMPIQTEGVIHKFIPYRDYENGPLEQFRLTFEVRRMRADSPRHEVTLDLHTRSECPRLNGITLTIYTGTPAQPYQTYTLTSTGGYHSPRPKGNPSFICSEHRCHPDADGKYLFKIEI